jgi:hypothetical protein
VVPPHPVDVVQGRHGMTTEIRSKAAARRDDERKGARCRPNTTPRLVAHTVISSVPASSLTIRSIRGFVTIAARLPSGQRSAAGPAKVGGGKHRNMDRWQHEPTGKAGAFFFPKPLPPLVLCCIFFFCRKKISLLRRHTRSVNGPRGDNLPLLLLLPSFIRRFLQKMNRVVQLSPWLSRTLRLPPNAVLFNSVKRLTS